MNKSKEFRKEILGEDINTDIPLEEQSGFYKEVEKVLSPSLTPREIINQTKQATRAWVHAKVLSQIKDSFLSRSIYSKNKFDTETKFKRKSNSEASFRISVKLKDERDRGIRLNGNIEVTSSLDDGVIQVEWNVETEDNQRASGRSKENGKLSTIVESISGDIADELIEMI